MAKVINLADHKKGIKPNSETFEHGGQHYTCTFDPNGPKGKQWVWRVNYVVIHKFIGRADSKGAAAVLARKRIHAMNKFIMKTEEREVNGDVDAT